MNRTLFGVIFMAVLLGIYLWATGYQGNLMVVSGQPILIIMGLALVVLPIVGAWLLFRELRFGMVSARLVRQLREEGNLPVDDLPHRPSGRALRSAADEELPVFAADVDSAPESWRAWFRLGLAYDACGDRKRARESIRRAITLYKKDED
jgi:tetratricopeptide (TPR) repeat protein